MRLDQVNFGTGLNLSEVSPCTGGGGGDPLGRYRKSEISSARRQIGWLSRTTTGSARASDSMY